MSLLRSSPKAFFFLGDFLPLPGDCGLLLPAATASSTYLSYEFSWLCAWSLLFSIVEFRAIRTLDPCWAPRREGLHILAYIECIIGLISHSFSTFCLLVLHVEQSGCFPKRVYSPSNSSNLGFPSFSMVYFLTSRSFANLLWVSWNGYGEFWCTNEYLGENLSGPGLFGCICRLSS